MASGEEAAAAIEMVSTLKDKLSVATVLLLASSGSLAENEWILDASYLSYSESQERVNVSKGIWDLTRANDKGSTTVQVIHDTMSGASPTGAITGTEGSVTYTGPSGAADSDSSMQTKTNAAEFSDTRIQIGIDQDRLVSRFHSVNYGAVYSSESDYDSVGGSVGMKRESESRNTVVDIGVAATFDTVSRSYAIGTPGPLSSISSTQNFSEGERNTFDMAAGVSQIINKRSLAQVTFSISQSNGYHTDPYKVISAADSNDRVLDILHESRPDSRFRYSTNTKYIHQFENTKHAIHLGYRYYGDDWGLRSNTVEARLHYKLSARHFIEPHFRLYQQKAADFFKRKLDVDVNQNTVLPLDGFVSADYRLDAMRSKTVGLKYGFTVNKDIEIRMRIAYLQQRFATAESGDNDAVIAQTSFRYHF